MPCNTLSIKCRHTSARCENVRRADISSICSSCAPALQGISNLCQHSHAAHQSDLQYKNMSYWLAYFWSVKEQRDIRAPDTQHEWYQRRFWVAPQKILHQARSITTPENHHNRYSTTPDATPTVGQTKEQCIGTFYLCVSEKSWLTHLDFHRTLLTRSSGVSKPTPLDDLLD